MIVRLAKSMGCIAFVYARRLLQPYDSSSGNTYQLYYRSRRAARPRKATSPR